MTQHDQSIGGPDTVDGIAGTRSGTEGATSGAGADKGKGEPQKDESRQRQGARVQNPGGLVDSKPKPG